MVSVGTHSKDRVAKATWRRQQASVKEKGSECGEPGHTFLDVPDDSIRLAVEGTGNPQGPLEQGDQSGDLVWDEEESEALRQARKDAELTTSADSIRTYLNQIGKTAL